MTQQDETPAEGLAAATGEGPLPAGETARPARRHFDETRLSALSADEIRALREREGVSQAVLARLLNVTPGLVNRWETGERQPAGAALKLLLLARRHGLASVA